MCLLGPMNRLRASTFTALAGGRLLGRPRLSLRGPSGPLRPRAVAFAARIRSLPESYADFGGPPAWPEARLAPVGVEDAGRESFRQPPESERPLGARDEASKSMTMHCETFLPPLA